jgi:hypothetical protein
LNSPPNNKMPRDDSGGLIGSDGRIIDKRNTNK